MLLGLDGRKMSKSLGNAIALSDDRATDRRQAARRPHRLRTHDHLRTGAAPAGGEPAHAGGAVLGTARRSDLAAEVGDGGGGALKALVVEAVDGLLAPIRERRAAVERRGGAARAQARRADRDRDRRRDAATRCAR